MMMVCRRVLGLRDGRESRLLMEALVLKLPSVTIYAPKSRFRSQFNLSLLLMGKCSWPGRKTIDIA
jgi:hypothetical protein